MDKSLDEIIAGNGPPRRRGGGGGPRRGRGGGPPRDRIGKDSRDSRDRRGPPPRDVREDRRYTRSRSRSISPPPRETRERRDHGRERRPPQNRGTTIMISNLYYGLNEDDLEDLFGKVGPITSVKIQYDKSGRSEGYAWVTFEQHDHAMEAVGRFDGKKAAGQVITINLARGFGFQGIRDFERRLEGSGRGGSSTRGRGGRGRGRGRGGRGASDNSGGSRRPKKSAEELDAELDAYMNNEKGIENGDENENPGTNGDEPNNNNKESTGKTDEMVLD